MRRDGAFVAERGKLGLGRLGWKIIRQPVCSYGFIFRFFLTIAALECILDFMPVQQAVITLRVALFPYGQTS